MLNFETGEFIKSFDTIKEAAEYTNLKSQSMIGKVCRGERPFTKFNNEKVKWEYAVPIYIESKKKLTDEHRAKISISNKGKNSSENSYKSKKVDMFSLDGKFIQTFICMRDAAKFLGVTSNNNHISDVCRGKRKSYHGFIWKYSE